MYIIAIQTHIFADSVPQVYEYQCLNQDSSLPLALEEKEEDKTLWYELESVLPWLPSFNSLFKTSTLKKKICSPLGEGRV